MSNPMEGSRPSETEMILEKLYKKQNKLVGKLNILERTIKLLEKRIKQSREG